MFQWLGWIIRSALREYLSLMLDKSHLQRLGVSILFPISLSVSTSQDRDPNCLASLPSSFILWAMISQHQRSQVTQGSFNWQLKSICISWRSLRDRDGVITSGPASSSCSEGPASSSSLTMWSVLEFLLLSGGSCYQHRLFFWCSCSFSGHGTWRSPCFLLPMRVLSSDQKCATCRAQHVT